MSTTPQAESPERTRLDKWLWAARFYRTRGLAADAVEGGKVRLNDARTKPAKEIRTGDSLDITIGDMRWTIEVKGLSGQRRPAADAQQLYQETAESVTRRRAAMDERRIRSAAGPTPRGRPTKRDRRQIDDLRRGADRR